MTAELAELRNSRRTSARSWRRAVALGYARRFFYPVHVQPTCR